MRCETVHLKDTYPFSGEDGRDPTLTIYIQDVYEDLCHIPKCRPAMLICPGGGYRIVSRRESEPIAVAVLPMGYNAFVLNYSVRPNGYPVQLVEVAAALELIYANAEQWHVDVDRIAIMGFSAGGHLSAHYSNVYDSEIVRKVFPQSKPVQAVVLGYPAISTDEVYGLRDFFCNRLLNNSDASEAELAQVSCEKLVSEKTPPTFMWHTAADQTAPVGHSLAYAMALSKYQIPFGLHVYPFGRHGLVTVDRQSNETVDADSALAKTWLPEMDRWLKTIFA